MEELVALAGASVSILFFKVWLQEHVLYSKHLSTWILDNTGERWKTWDRPTGVGAGVLSVLVNNSWCNPRHVTEGAPLHPRCGTAGCEFPSMLSSESSPVSPADAAFDIMTTNVAKQQTQPSRAFMVISGDFNHTYYPTCSELLFILSLFIYFTFLWIFPSNLHSSNTFSLCDNKLLHFIQINFKKCLVKL